MEKGAVTKLDNLQIIKYRLNVVCYGGHATWWRDKNNVYDSDVWTPSPYYLTRLQMFAAGNGISPLSV